MSLAFLRALTLTLAHEGGYADVPADHGGATLWGITQATYNGWRHAQGLPSQPVRDMTRAEMQAIYETDYWVPAHCDELPLNLACCHFDAFVNHRPAVAMRFLQTAVGAYPDGKFGPQTLAKVAEATVSGEEEVVRSYLAARLDFYDRLVEQDPTQVQFMRGWTNRVQNIAQELGVGSIA